MKLIFLYGPPGVGKLTVAKELSKVTGYKIFHNHLTNDLVESIFEWGSEAFVDLVRKYRLELIEAAARKPVDGLIFTFVYAGRSDDAFIKKLVSRVEKYGGEVCFVRLFCDTRELVKRIKHPSRKSFNKIKKLKTLKEVVDKYNLFLDVPYNKNLIIDNTKISPMKVARQIKEHYKL